MKKSPAFWASVRKIIESYVVIVYSSAHDRPAFNVPSGADESWRDSAACKGVDPELFFPVGDTGPAREQTEQAKKICQQCAVMNACLDYALEYNQEHGVWGDTSEAERRPLRRAYVLRQRDAM